MLRSPELTECEASPQPETRVLCPLCDYDMHGLAECRCPECGSAFTWEELLDPERARHPYLFEHHPERNVRSAVRTFVGGWRPRRFWSSLRPAQPSRPKRLVVYGLLCSGLYGALFTAALVSIVAYRVEKKRAACRDEFSKLPQQMQMMVIRSHGSLQAALRANGQPDFLPSILSAMTERDAPFVLIAFLVVPLIWPWATFLSLMVYQQSVRRSRIKPIHLLRVSIYSYDALAAVSLLVPAVAWASTRDLPAGFGPWALGAPRIDGTAVAVLLGQIFAVVLLFCAYRLATACEKYLQFRLAVPAAVCSQIIVFLLACCIVFTTDLFFEHVPRRVHLWLAGDFF